MDNEPKAAETTANEETKTPEQIPAPVDIKEKMTFSSGVPLTQMFKAGKNKVELPPEFQDDGSETEEEEPTTPETLEEKKEDAEITEEGGVKEKEIDELEQKKLGLEKETSRLLDIVSDLRKTKSALRKNPDEIVDDTLDYGSETQPANTQAFIAREFAKRDFFDSHEGIYKGQDGLKRRKGVEEYIKIKWNPQNLPLEDEIDLYEMVHNKLFGNFEHESAINQAKVETRTKMLMNDIAATADLSKGKTTLKTKTPQPKKIIMEDTSPNKWYTK